MADPRGLGDVTYDGDKATGIPLTALTAEEMGPAALSVAHFNGALEHVRRARELEDEAEGAIASERTLARQRGHVTASVMGGYAVLEALLNECFTRHEPPLAEVDLSRRMHLAEV